MNDTIPLDTVNPEPEPRPRRSLRPIVLGVVAGVAAAALASGGIALASGLDLPDDDRLVITSSPNGSSANGSSPSPSATDDSTPSPSASPSDDASTNGTATYDQVTAAALAAVGGGTVIEVDRGDSPGDAAWKVEIRLANGNEAEVRLAADLTVLRVELDNDDTGNSGSGSDDSGNSDSGNSGSGSDDSGRDVNGSGGHGSDD